MSLVPLDGLRRNLERRWMPFRRIGNTCAATGALLGFVSLGALQIWLLFFPLAMAVAIRVMARWGWLPPAFDAEVRRRGLRFLYLAPLPFFLLIVPGVIYIFLIPFGLIFTLFLEACSRLSGGIPFRHPEDLGMGWRAF